MKKKIDLKCALKYQNPKVDGDLIGDSFEQIELSIRQCGFEDQLHEAFDAAIERLDHPEQR